MKTKYERLYDLEGQIYNKDEVINRLSEIFNRKYECLEEDIKNEPEDEEDTEYHSVFTSTNKGSHITINYDKSTNRIVAPIINN